MAKRKATRTLHMQSTYLEPEKAELLDELAAQSRIPKAVLLREAVDLLLLHHGKLEEPSTRALVEEAIASVEPIVTKCAAEIRGSLWKGNCATATSKLGALKRRLQEF